MMSKGYNGWKNYETWNISLWINNDEGLYDLACRFMRKGWAKGVRAPYRMFADYLIRNHSERTDDGVKWDDSRISYRELNAMMRELVD